MTDFTSVTETWGLPASSEQLSMAYTRYRLAADLVKGKRVLELGCGAGMGIEYLGLRGASLVVGGDYTMGLLNQALGRHPKGLFLRLDAQRLPFHDAAFDVVLMLEMIYYLADLDLALREAVRVLRPGGYVVISAPNPDRPHFNRSPFSTRYVTVSQLRASLERLAPEVRIFGAFPVEPQSRSEQIQARVRGFAVRHNLIPRSMKAKALVKRIVYRRLTKLDVIRDGMAPRYPVVELDDQAGTDHTFKNLYAVARIP